MCHVRLLVRFTVAGQGTDITLHRHLQVPLPGYLSSRIDGYRAGMSEWTGAVPSQVEVSPLDSIAASIEPHLASMAASQQAMARDLRTLRRVVMFFVWLWIIGIVLAVVPLAAIAILSSR